MASPTPKKPKNDTKRAWAEARALLWDHRQSVGLANDAAIQKGIAWLKSNQRESGGWFTKSINSDRYHFLSHAGTAYAVLALKACE